MRCECSSADGSVTAEGRNVKNDIAVLQLKPEDALKWDSLTQPICLPNDDAERFDWWQVQAIGWGVPKEGEHI
jgi:hypothetical protein